MGADKGRVVVGGETMVARAVRALSGSCGEVVLACGSEPRDEGLNLRLGLDRAEGQGPLGGLLAAVEACAAEWFAVLACDLPRMVPAVPVALLERARSEELDVCMLASPSGKEPLIAVYRRTCLAPIRAAMLSGTRRVDSFHGYATETGRALKVGVVSEDVLPDDLKDLDVSMNLNTAGQLAAELSFLSEDAS
jgi:molybdopterin-guanine dinucleotide biosynthesis protein A